MLGFGAKGAAPFQNAYGSSKAWVRRFTQSLAQETKDSGVGVFAFSPGMVLTDLLTHVEVIQGSEPRLKNFPVVLRILAKPPEAVTEKAVWLASSATDGKTGLEVLYGLLRKHDVWRLARGLTLIAQTTCPDRLILKLKVIPPFKLLDE